MPCLADPACSNVATCCVNSALGLGLFGSSCAIVGAGLAAKLADDPRRRRHCILLWMSGGPSQTDTFDMKPGHANGGEFKEIATSVPGLRFSEHLPKLGEHGDRLAVVRSLSTKEGDHARGTHLVRTGHPPMGGVAYPSICCSLAKELESASNPLPSYVSVAPPQQISPAAFGPGFLGPRVRPGGRGGRRGPMPNAPAAQENAAAPLADLKLENIDRARGRHALAAIAPNGIVERDGAKVPRKATALRRSTSTTARTRRPPT